MDAQVLSHFPVGVHVAVSLPVEVVVHALADLHRLTDVDVLVIIAARIR